jgi:phage head maturation protease
LENSLFTFDGAFVVLEKHPETWILTDPSLISGKVDQVSWDPVKHEVQGHVHLNKKKVAADFLASVKAGVLSKNSMGFLYEEDWNHGDFNGQPYDYVQRKILIDHIAVGVPNPRDPGCTLGVDESVADNERPLLELRHRARPVRSRLPE